MPRGGARPNSGPRTKVQKLLEAKDLAGWFTPDFQKAKWQALLNAEDLGVQTKAMCYLSDRIYGKAPQAMEVKGEVEVIRRVISNL